MLSPTSPATCKHTWTMSCSILERRLDTKTFLRHSTSASKSTICQTTLSQILKKCHRWFNRSKNNNCVTKTLTNNQNKKKKALLNHTEQSQQENAHLTKNLFRTNVCCDDVFGPDKRCDPYTVIGAIKTTKSGHFSFLGVTTITYLKTTRIAMLEHCLKSSKPQSHALLVKDQNVFETQEYCVD